MTAVVLTVLQTVLAGLPAAVLLDRGASRPRLLGMSYLLGAGITSLILLALSVLFTPWSLGNVTAAILAVTAALWMMMMRKRRDPAPAPVRAAKGSVPLAAVVFALTGALVVAHAVLATRAPVGEWDFWSIWGLKARVFFEYRGLDWAFLESSWNAFSHPDYPPLLPLHYALIAVNQGAWSDRYLGIVTTLFGTALVLVAWDFVEEELRHRALAAVALFAIAWIGLPLWMGMAEGPFIALSMAALLFVRSGRMTTGAVLLGLAASTKNEGISLIVAVVVALMLSGRRKDIPALWPAAAIVAPWLLLRALHDVPTPLVGGALHERVIANLSRLPELGRGLAAKKAVQPLLWIAIPVAFLASVRRLGRERFLLIAVAMQCLFYLGAYLGTPYGLQWHVQTSWPRVIQHLAGPLVFVALVVTGRRLSESADDGDGDGDQGNEDGQGNGDGDDHRDHGYASGQ